MTENGGLPAASWQDDPEDSTQLRYWDGGAWTEHRSPKAGVAQSAVAQPAVAQSAEAQSAEAQSAEAQPSAASPAAQRGSAPKTGAPGGSQQ